MCWAAQLGRIPPLFQGRRRYVMILTNRRILLFAGRRRHTPRPTDLVLGKRYEWFKLGRVRRARPLMQVLVTSGNGARMLFEFQPHRRELARTLVSELASRRDMPALPAAGPPAAGPPAAGRPTPATAVSDQQRTDESVFWGPSTKSS